MWEVGINYVYVSIHTCECVLNGRINLNEIKTQRKGFLLRIFIIYCTHRNKQKHTGDTGVHKFYNYIFISATVYILSLINHSN